MVSDDNKSSSSKNRLSLKITNAQIIYPQTQKNNQAAPHSQYDEALYRNDKAPMAGRKPLIYDATEEGFDETSAASQDAPENSFIDTHSDVPLAADDTTTYEPTTTAAFNEQITNTKSDIQISQLLVVDDLSSFDSDEPLLPPVTPSVTKAGPTSSSNTNTSKTKEQEETNRPSRKKESYARKDKKIVFEEEPSSKYINPEHSQHEFRTAPKKHKHHNRRRSYTQHKHSLSSFPQEIAISLPITIRNLSTFLKRPLTSVLHFINTNLYENLTDNDTLKQPLDVSLIGTYFNCEITVVSLTPILDSFVKTPETLSSCPPIISCMGHVDHGKTSIIDWFRKSRLVDKETGHITQQVNAFSLSYSNVTLTIIDTPGHAAFTNIRARTAQMSDIVIIVIDGKEGIKEQTKESITAALNNNAAIIIAANKNDHPHFDLEKVYRQCSDLSLVPEKWGGDTVVIPCSALTGNGMNAILDNVILLAEMLNISADPQGKCYGQIVDSVVNKQKGLLVTIIIKNGTLQTGDWVYYNNNVFKVRHMEDDLGRNITTCLPNRSATISGFTTYPNAGDKFYASDNKTTIYHLQNELSHTITRKENVPAMSLENIFTAKKPAINLITKSNTQGSLEAIHHMIDNIKSDKVDADILLSSVGPITENDIDFAKTTNSIILALNISLSKYLETYAKQQQVTVIHHSVIYHILDEVKEIMRKKVAPVTLSEEAGELSVLVVFKSSKLGAIAGCLVTSGNINRKHRIQVWRNTKMLWEGPITSMKIRESDVKSAKKGDECGIILASFDAFETDDKLIAIASSEERQTL